MLNAQNERELAYLAEITEIRPIEGYDRVEYARVGAGWWVIVRKEQFHVGDLGIYIEIDAKVPQKEPFMFLEKRDFKVKTLKMCKVVSQGLLMHPEDFGWTLVEEDGMYVVDNKGTKLRADDETRFLTKKLGIVYAAPEDNVRKSSVNSNMSRVQQRYPKWIKSRFGKFLMSHKFSRQLILKIFGRPRAKKGDWPKWVQKTDEERVQNMPWLFPGNDEEWIATEKIDGSSTTFTLKGRTFLVCSRNVAFTAPTKECYYDTNIYLEMAKKYEMQKRMKAMFRELKRDNKGLKFLTIQAETYGDQVQKRNYSLENGERDMAIFNVILGFGKGYTKRMNPLEGSEFVKRYSLPYVPVVDAHFKIPETCDEILITADGRSVLDNGMREGLVFRSYDGVKSFKAVSNAFLIKYHG